MQLLLALPPCQQLCFNERPHGIEFAVNLKHLMMDLHCCRVRSEIPNKAAIGKNACRHWRTSALKEYAPALCKGMALSLKERSTMSLLMQPFLIPLMPFWTNIRPWLYMSSARFWGRISPAQGSYRFGSFFRTHSRLRQVAASSFSVPCGKIYDEIYNIYNIIISLLLLLLKIIFNQFKSWELKQSFIVKTC